MWWQKAKKKCKEKPAKVNSKEQNMVVRCCKEMCYCWLEKLFLSSFQLIWSKYFLWTNYIFLCKTWTPLILTNKQVVISLWSISKFRKKSKKALGEDGWELTVIKTEHLEDNLAVCIAIISLAQFKLTQMLHYWLTASKVITGYFPRLA